MDDLLNIPKKQHYVPQFLLRSFSEKNNKIYVFDKKLNRSFTSNVKDIGHENNFYDDQLLGYGIETEFKLSQLETVVAPIVEKITIEGSIKNLEDWEHKFLCLFSTVQMIRTNDTRELLDGFNQILTNRIIEWGYDPNVDVENYKTPSQAELKSSAINLIHTLPSSLVEDFLNKKLSLLKAPEGQSFYISDNPIVKHNHFPREGRGDLGIGLKGIEIYFPISPLYCLSFLCGETTHEIITKIKNFKAAKSLGIAPKIDLCEVEKLVDSFENGTTNSLSIENMDFNNSLQVIQSTRFVYSCDSQFILAKDMLRTHPEISTQEKFVDGSVLF